MLVFARDPDAGPVKTRLAAGIGVEQARDTYRAMAEGVWSGLEHPALDRQLWMEPSSSVARGGVWLRGATRVRGQPAGDLGVRLTAAFEEAFLEGAPWAAAVGTDAPAVDATMTIQAGELLATHEVAVVPAVDGGYALIALKSAQPALFTDIPWSTSQVLAATLKRAESLGLRVALLPAVHDVDTAEDLLNFPVLRPRSGPSATRP